MNQLRIYILLLVFPLTASCQERFPMEFTVLVEDNEGNPVTDCELRARTFLEWKKGEGFGRDIYETNIGTTDESGAVKFKMKSLRGDLKLQAIAPHGFYEHYIIEEKFEKGLSKKWGIKGDHIKVVLRKIKNPVPLYARSMVSSSSPIKIPRLNEPCGFDLMESDWLPPYGDGKIADLIFKIDSRYDGVYDFETNLTMTFSNQEDGYIEFPKKVREGSKFRMPYHAPLNGYEKSLVKRSTGDPVTKKITKEMNSEMNYFLRLRTILDDEGVIKSANYAKIHGDINFNHYIKIDYYVNPTPNDRNLEFDLKRNLLGELSESERVEEP